MILKLEERVKENDLEKRITLRRAQVSHRRREERVHFKVPLANLSEALGSSFSSLSSASGWVAMVAWRRESAKTQERRKGTRLKMKKDVKQDRMSSTWCGVTLKK